MVRPSNFKTFFTFNSLFGEFIYQQIKNKCYVLFFLFFCFLFCFFVFILPRRRRLARTVKSCFLEINITKTSLFKYIETFTSRKLNIFR